MLTVSLRYDYSTTKSPLVFLDLCIQLLSCPLCHADPFAAVSDTIVIDAQCDLSMEYEHKSETSSGMYLRILDELRQRDGCCFVYVKGLKTLDDTLFKWLAEFTERSPWQFVFFEDVNTTWNLVENMDRATTIPRKVIKTRDSSSSGLELLEKKFALFTTEPTSDGWYDIPEDRPTRKRVAAHAWQAGGDQEYALRLFSMKSIAKKMEARIDAVVAESTTQGWVMISGDPGIGKTYYLDKIVQGRNSAKYKRLDGSSDDFVRIALTQELDHVLKKFKGSTDGILVLDEYHMLSPEQKKQLLSWTKQNLGKVKLIMISNRLDETDYDLFNTISKGDMEGMDMMQGVVETRGSLRKLIQQKAFSLIAQHKSEVMGLDTYDVLMFMYLWVRATRGLFGDEMMSMRPVKAIVEEYCNQFKSDWKQTYSQWEDMLHKELAKLLQKKQPTLASEFCELFVSELLQMKASSKFNYDGLQRALDATPLGDPKGKEDLTFYDPLFEQLQIAADEARQLALKELDTYFNAADGAQIDPGDRVDKRSMRVLICAALTDSSEVSSTGEGLPVASLSYPEFTMPKQQGDQSEDDQAQTEGFEPSLAGSGEALKRGDLQLCHPVIRMTFWVDYMYARARSLSDSGWQNEPGEANKRIAACCAMLRQRLHIVDLPMKFPQCTWTKFGSDCRLDSCEVMCARTRDFSDLDAMKMALQRGFTLPWAKIVRHWSSHPVTDWKRFSMIIEASRGSVLQEVLCDPEKSQLTESERQSLRAQLRTMINLSDHDKIPTHCIVYKQPNVDITDAKDPFYVSAWKMLRFCEMFKEKEPSYPLGVRLPKELTTSEHNDGDSAASAAFPNELVNTLCWASRYGYNSLEVGGESGLPGDAASGQAVSARQRLLQQHILLATHSLEHQSRHWDWAQETERIGLKSKIVDLWSHLFSDLFSDSDYSPEREEANFFPTTCEVSQYMFTTFVPSKRGLSYWTLLDIAESSYPPKPKWPQTVQTLSHLLNGTISGEQVDDLLQESCKFWDEIIVQPVRDEWPESKLNQNQTRNKVIQAILDPRTKLLKRAQSCILATKELEVLPDHISDFSQQGYNTQDIFGKFALGKLREDQILVGSMFHGNAFHAEMKRQYEYQQRQARNQ